MPANADINRCPICIESPKDEVKWEIEWIQCSVCDQWFHIDCLSMTSEEANHINEYHCSDCSLEKGPSILKRKTRRQLKKIDYVSLNEGEDLQYKFKHNHIDAFEKFQMDQPVEELVHIVDVRKQDVTDELLVQLVKKYQNKKPILVPRINPNLYPENEAHNKLDLKFPVLSVSKIADIIGEETPIEVMDVLTQNNSTNWNLGQWRDYYNKPAQDRDRIRNVISLEFSDTKLDEMIEIPRFVSEIDISNKLLHNELLSEDTRPKITKYCLMSVKDSFTDFHIDFGGTSVYYTVLKGHKSFIMYPPTVSNLEKYEQWGKSLNQGSIWFGDLVLESTRKRKRLHNEGETAFEDPYYVNNGIKIDIEPGDLLILPSGWIHSVYTSKDSLVIGGNFLTIYSLPTHLTIFDIERSIKVPEKFKLPNFTRIMWLIGFYYMRHLNEEVDVSLMKSLLNFYHLQLEGGKSYRSLIPVKTIGPVNKFMEEFTKWVENQDDGPDEGLQVKKEPDGKSKMRKL